MTYAHKTDANQTAIVEKARKMGATVLVLSMVGHGCPDLLVGWKGKNYLIEVKSENGKLTPDEMKFFDEWGTEIAIIRSPDDMVFFLSYCTE